MDQLNFVVIKVKDRCLFLNEHGEFGDHLQMVPSLLYPPEAERILNGIEEIGTHDNSETFTKESLEIVEVQLNILY
jgi:hypothetical protein